MKIPMKLQAIKWLDHVNFSESRWRDLSEIKKLSPLEVWSVGYVLKETKKKIILVSTFIEENQMAVNEFCIAKSVILERHDLEHRT